MEKSYNNFKLRAVWNPAGWYCGYVDLPDGKTTTNINTDNLTVHGGVTFVNDTTIGFDCAHYNDTPNVWTIDTVMNELHHLAQQIDALL